MSVPKEIKPGGLYAVPAAYACHTKRSTIEVFEVIEPWPQTRAPGRRWLVKLLHNPKYLSAVSKTHGHAVLSDNTGGRWVYVGDIDSLLHAIHANMKLTRQLNAAREARRQRGL